MKNIIKKADIVLIISLIILGIILTVIPLFGNSNGDKVIIYVEGGIYGTYSLSKNQTIVIEQNGNYNRVEIKDDKVQMMESSCDNQVCVMQGPIGTHYLPTICLPNKVVVEVLEGEE